jgi:hypothetical protein
MLEEHSRAGDVIVLLPEYSLLTAKGFAGKSELKAHLAEHWPMAAKYYGHAASRCEPQSWKTTVDREGLTRIGQRFHWGRKNLLRSLRGKKKVYVRSGFNRYGDMVAHNGLSSSVSDACVEPNLSRFQVDNDVVSEINEFSGKCDTRGVRVFFSYPPTPEHTYNLQKRQFVVTHEDLENRLAISIVGTPGQFSFAHDCFFDTTYHLARKGTILRTESLARGLTMELNTTRTSAGNWSEHASIR